MMITVMTVETIIIMSTIDVSATIATTATTATCYRQLCIVRQANSPSTRADLLPHHGFCQANDY